MEHRLFCFLSATPVSRTLRQSPLVTSFKQSRHHVSSLRNPTRRRSRLRTPIAAIAAAGGEQERPPQQEPPSTSTLTQGTDAKTDKKYKGWRLRIFSSIFLGYACYYFTRNSFTYAAPGLRSSLGFSLEQLGVITSLFPLAYGFSKLISGILADKFSSRVFMAAGLFVTGIINILFGMQKSMWAFCALWFLNGVFQGFGAPPCAKLLTNWFSKTERGTWWGFWNTSHNTGGFIIPLVAGYCVRAFGWNYGMIVPGMIALGMGLFLFNRLRDEPGTVGLPPVDVYRDDVAEEDKGKTASMKKEEQEMPLREKLMKHVFSNPYVWLLALSYFFVYFVRQGVSSWAHIYLLDYKGVANAQEAAFRVSGMEIGGLCGSLISGRVSDKLMRGRRVPVIILWMLGIMVSMVGLWYVPVAWRYVNWLSVFSIGFFIYGPQMLIGLAGAEIVDRSAVSSTIGLLGLISYLGASIAGYPLTKIVTTLGWQAYFASLLGFSAIAILLLLPMWRLGMGKKAKPVPQIKEPVVVKPVFAAATASSSALAGDMAVTAFENCSTCAGTGEILRLECGPATPSQGMSCRYLETPCPMCIGKGYLPKVANMPTPKPA